VFRRELAHQGFQGIEAGGVGIDVGAVEPVLMIWRNHSNGVLNVLINSINIISEKAKNDLLGFPDVASKVFFWQYFSIVNRNELNSCVNVSCTSLICLKYKFGNLTFEISFP